MGTYSSAEQNRMDALTHSDKEGVQLYGSKEAWRAHVPVTNEQHDVANGLISGFCVRCRMPWPCQYSPESTIQMERDAMVETIVGLEKERDQLLQLCRMSLQQLDFLAGKRMRGWDLRYLRESLQAAIGESEGSGPDYHSLLSRVMEWFVAFPHQGSASEFDTTTAKELYDEIRKALV